MGYAGNTIPFLLKMEALNKKISYHRFYKKSEIFPAGNTALENA